MPKARKNKQRKDSNRSPYGRRKEETRATLPKVVIVCDDTVAAPNYFLTLQRQREIQNAVRLNVIPALRGATSPQAVVDRAIAQLNELHREQQDSDERKRDSVWVVIDMEREGHRRQQAKDEKKRAESNGIRVALSDPCYEVWTLLHLEDTGTSFDDCGKVIDRIKKLWKKEFDQPFDRKTQIDCTKIIEMRRKATELARKHRENNDPSWTEVYKIIEAIEAHVLRVERTPST